MAVFVILLFVAAATVAIWAVSRSGEQADEQRTRRIRRHLPAHHDDVQ